MAINVSAYSIRKPVPAIVLFVVLMAMGLVSFASMPVMRFPNIDFPLVSVTVTEPSAAPAELETQVAKKVEDAVASLSGVNKVSSTLNDGASTTVIEFRLDTDIDRAVNDVKDAVTNIRSSLPATADEPVVNRIDVEGAAILAYSIRSADKTIEGLSWFVDDVVARELQALRGIGRVTRIGGVTREIQVRLDPARLAALGVTAATVNQQLRATNIELGGGKGDVGGQQQSIRTLAGAKSIDELARSSIILPGGREVRLGDLGEVVDAYEEPRSYSRLDGEPVVSLAVFRAKGASEIDVKDRVEARVAKLRAEHPQVEIALIDDTVWYTKGNYEAAMTTLIEGALLSVLVVFLFLRDWRATLISAFALPLSIIPTFWAMSMMGFSLNLVSLLAVTLVTGILVDDAIVEIENIARHMRMGKSPYKAAMEAADEIGLAVIAISFTIVAVFAPVSFMGGIVGQYFKQFGLTVAIAVLFSLLVARLVTPMMAAYLMRPLVKVDDPAAYKAARLKRVNPASLIVFALIAGPLVASTLAVKILGEAAPAGVRAVAELVEHYWGGLINGMMGLTQGSLAEIGVAIGLFGLAYLFVRHLVGIVLDAHVEEELPDGPLMRGYTGFLSKTLASARIDWRVPKLGWRLKARPSMAYVTIVAGFILFAVSIASMKFLPTGFLPIDDTSRIMVFVELPPGASLDDNGAKTAEISKLLKTIPEVKNVFVMGGTNPLGSRNVRYATMVVQLLHKTQRSIPEIRVKAKVSAALATVADVRAYVANDRGEREFQLAILSRDAEALAEATAKLESAMRRVPGLVDTAATAGLERPEIRIRPKLDEAARLGITPYAIAETVRVATIGDYDANLAKFTVGDRQVPIRVQLPVEARADFATLAALKVANANGVAVPLSAVADIGFGQGPSTIERYQRERQVRIGAGLAPGVELGDAKRLVDALPEVMNLPAGVRIVEAGDAEIQTEMFQSFATAMGLGLLLVLGVLILLFGSVFQPITILLSLPLSIGGVITALLVTHNSVSMPVVIGILMLMGIVTKNAIMLVDFSVEQVHRGVERRLAIIDAGRKRARPIIMTTIAMAAGMLPSAYGLGDGGEFRAPMAIAVIGGLIVSTVLSLVFVPSFYIVMDDVSRMFGFLFGRMVGPNEEADVYEQIAPAHQALPQPVPAAGAGAIPMPANDVAGRKTAGPQAAE
ncbi:MAG: efflux RND transporter permease subunit [Hyphomicrobiaceae bacterium]|nr:efflux RND transporter permease subunit [Hyphomicrobiaceae bacterium]